MRRAEDFFTIDDKEKIAAAITAVEARTAGEIAVMVVDQSDTYPEAIVLGAVLLGSVASLVVTDFYFHDSLWHFLPLACGFGLLAALLLARLPASRRWFIAKGRLEARVRERALRAFYEKQLYKTRDNTGVLFFLSLCERKVWVLADEGIYQKLKQDELNAHALEVATAVKRGQAAAGLCREITKVGAVLAHHFPIKADDTNELTNEVITG